MRYSGYYDYAPLPGPFETYLRPGEVLLWKGKPDTSAYTDSLYRGSLLFMASLALLLGAWFCGLPAARYLCLGLVAASGLLHFRRLFVSRRAEMVDYAVTEERLLVYIGGRRSQLFTYDLHTTPLHRVEEWGRWSWKEKLVRAAHGSHPTVTGLCGLESHGSIHFAGTSVPKLWDRLALPDPIASAQAPAFVVLREPRDVYRLINDAHSLPTIRSIGSPSLSMEVPEESR